MYMKFSDVALEINYKVNQFSKLKVLQDKFFGEIFLDIFPYILE